MRRPRSPDTLTTTQAALLLEVSHDVVARMADADELPSTKTPGGHRRFARADVLAYRDGRPFPRRARPEAAA